MGRLVYPVRPCKQTSVLSSHELHENGLLSFQFGTLIGTGLDFVEVHYGLGRPDYYLSQHQLHEYQKFTYAEWIQTFVTLTLTKVSICLFLIRIPTAKSLICPLQAAIVILVVSFFALTFLWIFQCQPISAAWSKDTISDPKCFSRGMLLRIILAQAGNPSPYLQHPNLN